MAVYSTNEFKMGLKVMLDADPCTILENEFVKPGKGQAFSRVKFRNLKTKRIIERTMKSGEVLEGADVTEHEMQYLYQSGESFHFMDPATYEQYEISEAVVSEAKPWLKGQDDVKGSRNRPRLKRRYLWRRQQTCHLGNRRGG